MPGTLLEGTTERPEYFEACIWEHFDVCGGIEGIALRQVTTSRQKAIWWVESHRTEHATRATVGPCLPHIGPDQEIASNRSELNPHSY